MTCTATAPDRFNRFFFAARYLQAVSRDDLSGKKILDLGSGENILSGFIGGLPVIQLDRDRSGARGCFVQGLAEATPFPDGMFDFTVCLDVLEHVAPSHRPLILSEIARVTSDSAIIAFPIENPANIRLEEQLQVIHQRMTGETNRFLLEHREHGLVDSVSTLSELERYFIFTRVYHTFPRELWFLSHVIDYLAGIFPDAPFLRTSFYRSINGMLMFNGDPTNTYRTFIVASHSRQHPVISQDVIRPPEDTGWESDIVDAVTRTRDQIQALHNYTLKLEQDIRQSVASFQQLENHFHKNETELLNQQKQNTEITSYSKNLQTEMERTRDELTRLKELQQKYGQLEEYCLQLEKAIASRDKSLTDIQERYTETLISLLTRKPLA